MEKRTYWLIVVLLVIQLVGVAIAPVAAGEEAPAGAQAPDSITLDEELMHEIAVLGQQMQSHLSLDKDGTLSLGQVNAADLNVDKAYVDSYREALDYINAAIEQGLFTVDENFQVSWSEKAEQAAPEAAPADVEPDWTYYPSGPGLYVYFRYHDVHHLLPQFGLSTATSLASYLHRPWVSVPYTYHFTYYRVYRYYYYHAYSCCGAWSYVPWGYLSHYSGYYQPTYRYVYFWYPHSRYWYYYWCYW